MRSHVFSLRKLLMTQVQLRKRNFYKLLEDNASLLHIDTQTNIVEKHIGTKYNDVTFSDDYKLNYSLYQGSPTYAPQATLAHLKIWSGPFDNPKQSL